MCLQLSACNARLGKSDGVRSFDAVQAQLRQLGRFVAALLPYIPAVVIAVIVVRLFFGLVQTRWPNSYYSTSDILASKISQRWYRYSIYRFLPVLTAAILVAASGPNSNDGIFLATLTFGLVHAATTSGYAIVRSAIQGSLSARQALVDASVFVVIVIAAVLGGLISPFVRQFVPGFDKYIEVLLTGIIASLSFAYINRWTSADVEYPTARELLALAPSEVVERTKHEARRFRVDRELALAVLLAETVQRPRWIRRAESLTGGRLGLSRTHGPFQNMPSASCTDDQSIVEAMRNLSGAVLPRSNGYVHSGAHLAYHLERHNTSEAFRDVSVSIYRLLSGEILAACDEVSSDGIPLLRQTSVKRVGYEWHLAGDAGDEAVDVQAVIVSPQAVRVYPVMASGSSRREWTLVVPLDSEAVRMWSGNASGAGEMAVERCINPAFY